MKRLLLLLITFVIVLSLTGCTYRMTDSAVVRTENFINRLNSLTDYHCTADYIQNTEVTSVVVMVYYNRNPFIDRRGIWDSRSGIKYLTSQIYNKIDFYYSEEEENAEITVLVFDKEGALNYKYIREGFFDI